MALKRLERAEVKVVDQNVAKGLAEEFAAWRLGGCPGYGFSERFKAKVAMAARQSGVTPGMLFSEAHRLAYEIIDSKAVAGNQS
jgi:hypothetical protein